MSDISIRVARLEKEFDFWTRMYIQKIPIIKGTALEQVKQLELNLNDYRDKYRQELEKDLGQDFSIEKISEPSFLSPLKTYFFPMNYCKNFAGIILPFFETKKVFFNPRIRDNAQALEVFSSRGYKIEKIVSGMNRSEASLMVVGNEEILNSILVSKDSI